MMYFCEIILLHYCVIYQNNQTNEEHMNLFGRHLRNDENWEKIGAKAAIAKLIINYHNLGCVWDKLFIFYLKLRFSWSSYAMVMK